MGKKKPIPIYQGLIETHCHLDYLKGNELTEVLNESTRVGIEKIITITVEPDNFDTILAIAEENDHIFCTRGVHPHEAKKFNQEAEQSLRQKLNHEKIVAVGEIGLDYHYDNSPRDIQRKVFERHLEIAIEFDLPVVIHTRDADQDTINILSRFQDRMSKKGVIHSFTSGEDLAKQAIEWGFCLGFNGIITFNKAENVRDIVKLTPRENILLETDSPFLTPVPYRGRENAPFYLPFVVEKVAEIKGMTPEELVLISTKNAKRVFALS